jgi:hypothetical protein
MPARQCPIAESDPVEIHKMWRDRRGNALVFALKSYEGRAYFDIRTFFTSSAGILTPTKKGCTIPLGKLIEVERAVTKAIRIAREHGLIEAVE